MQQFVLLLLLALRACFGFLLNGVSEHHHHHHIPRQPSMISDSQDMPPRKVGQLSDKRNINKSTAAVKKSTRKSYEGVKESVEDLERQVAWKYGSSKSAFENDEDDIVPVKPPPKTRGPNVPKFSGFEPKAKSGEVSEFDFGDRDEKQPTRTARPRALGPSTVSNEEEPSTERRSVLLGRLLSIRKNNEKLKEEDHIFERKLPKPSIGLIKDTLESFYEEANDVRVVDKTPSESSTFRLRKPLPPTQEQLASDKRKAEELVHKEVAIKAKNQERKALERTQFIPFTFGSEDFINKDTTETLFSVKTFSDLGINDPTILKNLEAMGIFNPTKIQELAVPLLQEGADTLIQAQTGSGKTLAFLLPLISVINSKIRKVQAIILAPSRELVTQIALVGDTLFRGTDCRILPIIGGANVRGQINRLRDDRPQIIVATPGRLAELIFGLERLRLGMVKAVILDEVDNLLREPYTGELQTILEATPVFKRQSLNSETDHSEASRKSFDSSDVDDNSNNGENSKNNNFNNKRMVCFASATGNDPKVAEFIDSLYPTTSDSDNTKSHTQRWIKISAGNNAALPLGITHGLISCPRVKGLEMLKKLLKSKPAVNSSLIFVNDPHRVEIVCDKLLEMGIVAAPLHGDSSKDDRKEILNRLRDGRLGFVVTTELAARGIDIPNLSHVVNFELPTDAQHYVHRAGRCGRAGRPGLVINFATPDTKFVIRRFGKQLGVKVRDCEIREGNVFLKMK